MNNEAMEAKEVESCSYCGRRNGDHSFTCKFVGTCNQSRLPARVEEAIKPKRKESLYIIPPGCIYLGDGLNGMACTALEHYKLKIAPSPIPSATASADVSPELKLLADVMHLWIDGYISKNSNSSAPDSISSDTFDAIEHLLTGRGISVDYSGWRVNELATMPIASEDVGFVVELSHKRPHQRAHGDVERGFRSCYAQEEADVLFASLETQLVEARKEIAELERHYQDYKNLITKCLGAGITFQGDDDPLTNERAERAESTLAQRDEEIAQWKVAVPLSEWHDDMGSCLWWDFPLNEPPYVGSPDCDDWPGYHTHFTRLTNNMCPEPRPRSHD